VPAARGLFIVLEGPDKSGKSTQARLLVEALQKTRPVLHTREPGGTSFAEEIRRILLDPKHPVHPIAELMLYEASRAQHTEETIRPALKAGKVVVCERYTLSTMVYQGYARGIPLDVIERANEIATGGLKPDLTIILDIPSGEFGQRDKARTLDRIENEPESFRRKVREGYRKLAPKDALIVDGRLPIEEILQKIMAHV
jgi:dTMP kinase